MERACLTSRLLVSGGLCQFQSPLSNGVEMSLPVDLLRDLHGTSLNDLAEIEITPLANGRHWPRFDADVLVEGLIRDIYWFPKLDGGTDGTHRQIIRQPGKDGSNSSEWG